MNIKGYILLLSVVSFSCISKKEQDNNLILGDEVVTFIVQKLPASHNFNDSIYISGNFEGWSGGRDQFKLKKEKKQYIITIPKYLEHINYKFTKGNWETVECKLDGNPIENRTYSFKKLKDTVLISIVNWNPKKQQNKISTAAENVHVFAENFQMPQLKRKRKISVYLPPNYNTSEKDYPVLYMQDGQNVFDVSTSYTGEWEVDETLNKVFKETGFGLIVVAIDHGTDKRLNEYSPWDHIKYGKGEGKLYLDFLVNTLKPEIDKTFRTKPDNKNTAIIGSSLGGLFAHYATFEKPDIFGKAGVFSPSFRYNESVYEFTAKNCNLNESRLYYLVGEKEGDTMVKSMNDMVSLIKNGGISEYNIFSKVVPHGTHSESFWKTEFEGAIRWLFNVDNQ